MSVINALSRLAEFHLSGSRSGSVSPRATLDLKLLGSLGSATLDGVPVLLTPRQLDYLSILETREELSLDQLRMLVDGDDRHQCGDDPLRDRPPPTERWVAVSSGPVPTHASR